LVTTYNSHALWFTGPGKAALLPEVLVTPETGEFCTIRTLYSAVSEGTERLVLAGKVPLDLHQSMRVPYMGGDFSFPVKYGYSLAGVVEDGPVNLIGAVVHLLHPHQEICCVHAADVFRIPEDVPPRRAVLASNMETAVTAIWDARPSVGERVLIVGFGSIGALIAQILRSMPGVDLYIAEVDDTRSRSARELGFRTGRPGADEKFDLAFHTSGSASGLQESIDCVGTEGRIIDVSWYGSAEMSLRLGGTFHSQRKTIVASQVSHLPAFQTARWDRLRRKQLVFSLLRDPAFDFLQNREIPFNQLPEFFNNSPIEDRAIAPLVSYR
jgi:NADPH:quinone reductase-like Zn-dependent oxidoreductase